MKIKNKNKKIKKLSHFFFLTSHCIQCTWIAHQARCEDDGQIMNTHEVLVAALRHALQETQQRREQTTILVCQRIEKLQNLCFLVNQ